VLQDPSALTPWSFDSIRGEVNELIRLGLQTHLFHQFTPNRVDRRFASTHMATSEGVHLLCEGIVRPAPLLQQHAPFSRRFPRRPDEDDGVPVVMAMHLGARLLSDDAQIFAIKNVE
jgi:hypothetical protein